MRGTYFSYIIGGFFSGSILYSYLLPKYLKHVDITEQPEDHNPGGANAFTYAGKWYGIAGIVCDLLKGFLPIHLACQALSAERPLFALVLAAPVFGHAFSPLRKGKGGKAIAVSFGVLLGLYPQSQIAAALILAMLFFSLVLVVKPHRLRTKVAFLCTAAVALFCTKPSGIRLGIFLVCAVVLWKHHVIFEEERQVLLFNHRQLLKHRKNEE